MRIILSPAKKMKLDFDSLVPNRLPQFLSEAESLSLALQSMTEAELQTLWKCNEAIAKVNVERLRTMDLHRRLTPAVLAYEGIQYQYMAPNVFEEKHFSYIQEHLRILSGFYGLLRPFDGVVPYRLEMQARLSIDGCKDLYQFWGSKLADQLAAETDLIVNLASKEYSKAVQPHLPPKIRCLSITFGERKEGKILEKGTICKMARGQMVRWLAENQIKSAEDITSFSQLDYQFSNADSTEDHVVFIKGGS